MNPGRTLTLLLILGVIATAVGMLGWLFFVFARPDPGPVPLVEVPGVRVDLLGDVPGHASVEEVARVAAGSWVAYGKKDLLWVGLDQVTWMRISLPATAVSGESGVLTEKDWFTDRVELWRKRGDTWETQHSGLAVPASTKALAGREVAFPVTPGPADAEVLFLRYECSGPYLVGPLWWDDERAFHLARTRDATAESLYLGLLGAMFGYSTLLWLRLRAKDIGFYVLYLSTVLVFFLLARTHVVALGLAMEWSTLTTMLTVGILLSSVFLTCFARTFLEVAVHLPRVERLMRVWCLVLCILAVMALSILVWPFNWWLFFANVAAAVTHVSLLLVALGAWYRGVWQARFFVLAFGFLFAGSLPLVAFWVWGADFQGIGMRGLMIGSALEMLLLSLALAERFVRAHRQLLEETEQRRMMESTYAEELEIEVRERTQDLRLANADKDRILAVLGHDLRSPLIGLMRAAGGTPSQFGRDVERDCRSLLLLIEDLVQWARLRAGARTLALHRVDSLMTPAVALHASSAEHVGVKLTIGMAPDMTVETDLVLAQTLVRNLLANALRFARTEVRLQATADPCGTVRVAVLNDGPPLTAEFIDRLAKGYDGPITVEGGLGLRLCREICEGLGTRLQAATIDGLVRFEFTLPAGNEGERKPS